MELYLIRHGQSTNNAGLPHVAWQLLITSITPYEGVIRITCR